jgi:AraC-like DNA-binding protein
LQDSRFFVRLGALSEIDRTLSELGVEPEPLLAAHGLSTSMLADGDRLVNLEQLAALLEHAARETRLEHFPLALAARQDADLLGAIGLLLRTASTVREALRDIQSYLRTTHVSHIYWHLVNHGEYEAFEVSTDLPTISSHQARLAVELALAQCYRILQSVTGGRLKITRVCFRQGDNAGLGELRRFFHAPVQMAAEFDGLLFSPGALDLEIAQGDTRVHESVRQLLLAQQAFLSADSLAEQVKILVRRLLPTGQCSIERIARCFACDKRTLQRDLREDSDTTYQQLVDEVRFDTACFYLKESDIPVTQLAQMAGFSETTNFSRAFRKRFGESPRGWRQSHSDKKPSRRILPIARNG